MKKAILVILILIGVTLIFMFNPFKKHDKIVENRMFYCPGFNFTFQFPIFEGWQFKEIEDKGEWCNIIFQGPEGTQYEIAPQIKVEKSGELSRQDFGSEANTEAFYRKVRESFSFNNSEESVFVSEKYGFKFRYPKGSPIENEQLENHPEASDAPNFVALEGFWVGKGYDTVRVIVYETNYTNINDWVENSLSYKGLPRIENISIAGLPAKEYKSCSSLAGEVRSAVWKEGKVYEFSKDLENCGESLTLYKNIISSFTFN